MKHVNPVKVELLANLYMFHSEFNYCFFYIGCFCTIVQPRYSVIFSLLGEICVKEHKSDM